MKAYGLPRFSYLDFPDKQDCLEFGLKSMFMKQHGRYATRRVFKKKERSFVKHEIHNEIQNISHY